MAVISNSDEDFLSLEDCAQCVFGDEFCPVAYLQVMFNYDQLKNEKVKEMLDILLPDARCWFMNNKSEHFKVDARQEQLKF